MLNINDITNNNMLNGAGGKSLSLRNHTCKSLYVINIQLFLFLNCGSNAAGNILIAVEIKS